VSDNHQKDFEKMVSDSGLPMTAEQAKALWNAEAAAADSPFNNSAAYSPFWRAVLALVTAPVLWIANELLIKQLLPNFFLKTASETFLPLFGWAVDCERKGSVVAKGVLRFSRVVAAGSIEIAAGTAVNSTSINGKVYVLKTTALAVMEDGALSVVAPVTATEAGAGYNLAPGYYSVFPVPIAGVDSVVNEDGWLLTPGADLEAPDDYRARIRNQFSAINQFHTDAVYTKIITSFANINTRNVFFEHGAPRGPGTANAVILMDIGEPSAELIDSIKAHIMDDGNHGHGDDLLVMAMPSTEIDLTVSIVAQPYADEDDITQLETDVSNAVRAAFRENTDYLVPTPQPFSTFYFSVLAGELHKLFPLLASVTFSIDEIDSALSVPRLNSLTVETDD
jgi:uncharacterized phage protein gp47/JayE